MQMKVSVIFDVSEEIANEGNFPKILLFTASLIVASLSVEEFSCILLNWSIGFPQTVGEPD
jgi:hypothetical protein